MQIRKTELRRLTGPLWVLVTIMAMVMALSGFSYWSTTNAANELDMKRTSRAIHMAIESQVLQVKALAEDNAKWDDAALALYRDQPDADFGWGTWGAVSDTENVYDTLFVTNGHGETLMGYQDGDKSSTDFRRNYGDSLDTLIRQVDRGAESAGGIVRVGTIAKVVAVSEVAPVASELEQVVNGRSPVYIVLSRTISAKMLSRISDGLVLDGLVMTSQPSVASVILRDPKQRIVTRLGWPPSNPGHAAFWKASPIIGLVLLLGVFALGLLLAYCYRFFEELRSSALIDSLSNLPNRRALENEIGNAIRQGDHMALAFLDLDGFKAVNDNYGHGVGDDLIKKCSAAALEFGHECNMVARLGGDEFAILAVGRDADDRLARFAESFISRLSKPFHLGERTILIGASIGLASRSKGADDVAELMRRADIAMYASKHSGKMRITGFDLAIDQRQAESHRIDQQMRRALDRGEFEVHYQPQVGASTNTVQTLEALVRWTGTNNMEIGPDRFIPIAEETGLIDRIGLFVLDRACRDALAWPDIQLAVNISAAQLRNPDFPGNLWAIIERTGFPPERLELEITETYVVLDPIVATRVMTEIQRLGIRIALDDFGTGYASIGFLRQFNFDTLKIDKSLVMDAVTSEGARAMIQASIVVARSLGMSVVAEGVENEAQDMLMRVAGCDQLQGWLYSKAVTADAVLPLIHAIKNPVSSDIGLAMQNHA